MFGGPAAGHIWGEYLRVEDAETVATFTDGALGGWPAVTRRGTAGGAGWYMATLPEPIALRRLAERVTLDAGIELPPVMASGEQAEVVRRGGSLFVINHGADDAELLIDGTAGPVSVAESWDRLRTDSAFHAVLWISEWPRSQVFPGFLSPLVFTNGILRTVSLHYLPVRADQAARDLRKKKTELISDAYQRKRIGQIEDAGATAEYDDLLHQEADLTAGHGVLRTTGLVCVTAPTVDVLRGRVRTLPTPGSPCETDPQITPGTRSRCEQRQ
ncbi:SCO6880 family protein [Cryobacterium fucosi]|uniref:SCO6880 family protein n=1 Tax=Cryobacterium fucosi TaxID=1259157 RepID=UPI00141BC8AC